MSSSASPPQRGTRASDYDYALPPGRIAQFPCERRDESRLLVVDRARAGYRHLRFRDLVELVEPGDLLVVNESKVLPVRLLGRKPTGAPAEIFLLRRVEEAGAPPAEEGRRSRVRSRGAEGGARHARSENAPPEEAPLDGKKGAPPAEGRGGGTSSPGLWEALVRPGGKLKPGRRVEISDELAVEILDSAPGGGRIVRLLTSLTEEEAVERFGHVPLPPYIQREDEPLDRERYQTVYARSPGSVAAPTAGLHFTEELLDELALRGADVRGILLHVGLGTFRPIEVDDPGEHEMHEERYRVPVETAEAIERCRARGGRVWAVGTTVVRTLESAVGPDGRVRAGAGETRLFIRPPFHFRVVDRLLTNFHLPRSTLLMLVAAFAGYDRIMGAYREAIDRGYRFYSYGDAMAVL